ncbi:MAG: hypothetical protein F4X80_07030 [Chloroflexi bacterium]|nr:hypothetical protein [Chloroflexota bacterium]
MRIIARQLEDGRIEVAIRRRAPGGLWSEPAYPIVMNALLVGMPGHFQWIIPSQPNVGGWMVSGARQLGPADIWNKPRLVAGLSVRILARRHADGRTEFGLREDLGRWDGRVILPERRFFPRDPSRDGWLSTSTIVLPLSRPEPTYLPWGDVTEFDAHLERVVEYARMVWTGAPDSDEEWEALTAEITAYADVLLTVPVVGTHPPCYLEAARHFGAAAQVIAEAARVRNITIALEEEMVAHFEKAAPLRLSCLFDRT